MANDRTLDLEAVGIDGPLFSDRKQFVLENLFRGDNLHSLHVKRMRTTHKETMALETAKEGVRHSIPHPLALHRRKLLRQAMLQTH
jgi:hypothetical protein